MTRRVGNVVIIQEEPDGVCEYCRKVDELRPYGRNGARICFDCAMKPENKAIADATFEELLRGGKIQ